MARTPKAQKNTATKLSAPVFDQRGKEVRTIDLPEAIFGTAWNPDLVHQVVISMQSNARAGKGLAHTKDRGEVRGGGKKPWRQKGTGRARHGSSRSPIWVGGGITHGPRTDKDYSRTIPKKMRAKALYTAIAEKFRHNEVWFVDALSFSVPKTKDAKTVVTDLSKVAGLEKLSTKKQNAALIALSKNDAATKKSFANFSNISVEEARNLNPVDVLSATYLIIENPEESLKALSAKL